jgi:uncharacterized protein (TIGR03435 family)
VTFFFALFASIALELQSPPDLNPPLTFDVVSIKPAAPNQQAFGIRVQQGGGLFLRNITVNQMVAFAYNVRDFQVFGGPAWADTEHFDIVAKQDGQGIDIPNLTEAQRESHFDQMRHRVRWILSDRFQLKVHRDTKEMPVYVLTVAKSGPKLEEHKATTGSQNMRTGMGDFLATRATMAMLTFALANVMGRPVLDRTGLTGTYNFRLTWTQDLNPLAPPATTDPEGAAAAESGPTIFTALQEQLGLRVEARKGPAEAFVIDRVSKPSRN